MSPAQNTQLGFGGTLTPGESLVAGSTIGEYRIVEQIGEGGMGCVYAAVHPVLGKHAAIKVMRRDLAAPDAVARFVQEAAAVHKIGHPNIVDVFSFGTMPDGRCYFAMEYLRGETLAERVERGPVPLDETLRYTLSICAALEAVHGAGIVHRDLKPANVFLAEANEGPSRVKLLDFGLAKLIDTSGAKPGHTETGVIMGTPPYIAPEQARGRAVDARTDIYSLGAILYELLVGHPPFVADNTADLIAMVLTTPVQSPGASGIPLPADLEALVMGMLSKEADRRPSLDEIQLVLVSTGDLERSGHHAARRHRSRRNRRIRGIAIALASVIATAAVAAVVIPRKSEAPLPVTTPLVPEPVPAPVPDTPATGTLVVKTDIPAARILVDDTVVAADADTARLPVTADQEHRVVVESATGTRFERTVIVSADAQVEVKARLRPPAPPPRAAPKAKSKRKPTPQKRPDIVSPRYDDSTLVPQLRTPKKR